MPVDNFGREIPSLNASDLLGETRTSKINAEPSNKELGDIMKKMSNNFESNMEKTKQMFDAIVSSMNSGKTKQNVDTKIMGIQNKVYSLLSSEWNNSGGASGAKRLDRLVTAGLRKGSIHTADAQIITTNKLLIEIHDLLVEFKKCACPPGGGGGGGGGSPAPGAPAQGAPQGTITAFSFGAILDAVFNQLGIQPTVKDALAKLKNLADPATFGLENLYSGIKIPSFADINQSDVDIKRAIYQTQGLTRESGYLLENYTRIEAVTKRTGFAQEKAEQEILKYIKGGIKDRRTMNRIAIAQLNTERQLGIEAGELHEYFRMLHMEAGMTSTQLGAVNSNMIMIAKNTGITGEHMKKVISSSETFVKDMRNAGTLTTESLKNITQMTASFQKLGVAEQGAEMQKYLTNSTKLMLEGTDLMSTLMRQAAAAGGVYSELMTGTVQHSEKSMKRFSKGFNKVLKEMGLTTIEEFERLSAVEKMQKNMIAFARTGKQAGELLAMKKALDESSKTFADRYNDLVVEEQKKFITKEEQEAIAAKKRALELDKTMSVLGALSESMKNSGGDMNKAGQIFTSKRKTGGFDEALAAMGGGNLAGLKNKGSLDILTGFTDKMIPELNKQLTAKGRKAVGGKEDGKFVELNSDMIRKAIQKGDAELTKKYIDQIISAKQELDTLEQERLDPTTEYLHAIEIHAGQIRIMMKELIFLSKNAFGDTITAAQKIFLDELNKEIEGMTKIVTDKRKKEAAKNMRPEEVVTEVEEREVGTDLITKGGLAYLHPGEMIIPKKYNQVMQDAGPFTGNIFAGMDAENFIDPISKMSNAIINDLVYRGEKGNVKDSFNDLVNRGQQSEIVDLFNRRSPVATVPAINQMPLTTMDVQKNRRINDFVDGKESKQYEEKNSAKMLLALKEIANNTKQTQEREARRSAQLNGNDQLLNNTLKNRNNIDPRFGNMRGGHFTKSDSINIQY